MYLNKTYISLNLFERNKSLLSLFRSELLKTFELNFRECVLTDEVSSMDVKFTQHSLNTSWIAAMKLLIWTTSTKFFYRITSMLKFFNDFWRSSYFIIVLINSCYYILEKTSILFKAVLQLKFRKNQISFIEFFDYISYFEPKEL